MISRRDALMLSAAGLVAPSLGMVADTSVPAVTQVPSNNVPIFWTNAMHTVEIAEPGPTLDRPIIVRWQYSLNGGMTFTTFAVGGVICALGIDFQLYAIDVRTGEVLWNAEGGNPNLLEEAVLVRRPNEISALDRKTGTRLWTLETGQEYTQYALIDSSIYVGTVQELVALDLVSGDQLWAFSAEEPLRFLEAKNGVVCVGAGSSMFGFDAHSGTELWRCDTNDKVSIPHIEDDRVYFRSGDHTIYAIAIESGEERWQFNSDMPIQASEATESLVFILSVDSTSVLALDSSSGEEKWRIETDTELDTPTVKNGIAYFENLDSSIKAIDTQSGREIWGIESESNWINIHIADNHVFAFDEGGNFYSLDALNGNIAWSIAHEVTTWRLNVANNTIYLGTGDMRFRAIDTVSGEERWSYICGGRVWASALDDDMVMVIWSDDVAGYITGIGNPPKPKLATDIVLRGAPSTAGVERGTGTAGTEVSIEQISGDPGGQAWAEVTIDGVTGWIPMDAIDPATLPPEGEIEYVYVPE